MQKYISNLLNDGPDWELYMKYYEEARSVFSTLIGATPDEVALIPTVSYGINVIASSLRRTLNKYRVVLSKLNFPSVIHVWSSYSKRMGFETVLSNGSLSDYNQKVNEKTLAISLTHVHYVSGFREYVEDVVDIAHEVGSLVILDDAQATGVVPLDVRKLGIDILVTTCSKYLLGLPGLAFLYVRKDLIEKLNPLITSWFAHKEPFKFDLKFEYSNTARRFEIGTPPIPSVIACLESMKFINEIGINNIWNHVVKLSDKLINELLGLGFNVITPLDANRRGAHVSIMIDNPKEISTILMKKGIIVSFEGIDGCGKTTQAKLFYNYLREKKIDCVYLQML